MLTSTGVAAAVARLHARIAPVREALDAADRELGDGDTGMTVEGIVTAWNGVAAELPGDVGAALSSLGRETRRASGSSLGSVVAIGLAAAGRAVQGGDALDATQVAAALVAAVDAISARSGAAPGDKTVLDSLAAIAAALAVHGARDDGVLDAAIGAAGRALAQFRDRECRIGRARVYGARSAGRDDPGMLAATLLLRALRD
jgi:hypothetical protein